MISVNNAIMPWQCLFALLLNTKISFKSVLQNYRGNLLILVIARPFQDNWKMFKAMKLSSLQKDKVTPKIYY
jgi:hypothetical protein